MASPNEKLAASLARLQELQKDGRRVFRSKELTRIHRERLLKLGFLREVIKGWLISAGPESDQGDSTSWYASFWEFCAGYCNSRFGDSWYLSPEQSILLHSENTVIPVQLVVYSPKGTNNSIELLFNTSIYDLNHKQTLKRNDLTILEDLRLFSPEAALIKVPETFFTRYPVEAQVVLWGIRDVSDVLGRLLDGGHSVVAGRLAGAFRSVGRSDFADEILSSMKAAGYDIRETNPFAPRQTFAKVNKTVAPIIKRLQTIWETFRSKVIDVFPESPGTTEDRRSYLNFINEIYISDAYHSLSIEGYRVSPELIERVRSGEWDPDNNQFDRRSNDALAARGYWQAFQLVREAAARVFEGENAGAVVREEHRKWYRELLQPGVASGLIEPSVLAGYRNDAVFLRGSRHVPPRWEAVRDAMPVFFDLIEAEPEPSVRAVLGHWMFAYIHPYLDGNGRMARFLMNVMLASGGERWIVIRVEDRNLYMSALESASIDMDIQPFAEFIAERVRWSRDKK